ncbi:MAG: hypothetical protein ACO1Q7_04375 [Gemmatimonas sp.]
MLTSPLASLSGWSWTRTTATDVPKPLRLALPPSAPGTPGPVAAPPSIQWAVHGTGPATGLRFPTTGKWVHAQADESQVHWMWGRAADLPLFPELRTRLTFGNPMIAIRFEHSVDAHDFKGEPKGNTRGAPVELEDEEISVFGITVVAFAPNAPALDTIGVLRHLRDVLNEGGVDIGDPNWQSYVGAFDDLVQPLRVLSPGGSPAIGAMVSLSGGPAVTLTAGDLGDVLTPLGASRGSLSSSPQLNVSNGAPVVATSGGAPFPDGNVVLSPTTSHVSFAPVNAWLAENGSAALARFTRGNTVIPFADGVDTYRDMFAELNAAVSAGSLGVFYVTGYSLQHEAVLGPAGPEGTLRTVTDIARAMGEAEGDPRFLALQMLQLDPSWVSTVESSIAILGMVMSIAGGVATAFQEQDSPEQMSFFLAAQTMAYALMIGSASIDSLLEGYELNRGSIEALAEIPGVEAHLDPVDADINDNPHATTTSEIISAALNAQRKFNVFHQKIQIVRNEGGIHAYCGGIDLNANRTQDIDHASRGPFHDVHARVNGLAAGELVKTFSERWQRAAGTPLALDAVGALDGLPTGGPDVVQVARTYYGAVPGSGRGFSFAPNGERTIIDTLLQAIGQARRHIFIEDQYLTPPFEFKAALANAAANVSGPLVIIVPSTPDQPFGLARRQQFILDMREAWGDRCKVGILRKRFSRTPTSRSTAKGRIWLTKDVAEGDDEIEIGPPDRIPDAPFWLVVNSEAMRAYHKVPGTGGPEFARYRVDRADPTNLFKAGSGTKRSSHKKLAPCATGQFPGIYVHSKMVLIDDAFASIGSANCNRRGYYSDGECNIFALRETVADGDDNWIRNLRIKLWSEHLGVTEEYGRVALRDPALCQSLFDRKFTTGNRFTPFDAQPYATDLAMATEFIESTSAIGGIAMIGQIAAGLGAMIAGTQSEVIFDSIVDPGSQVG